MIYMHGIDPMSIEKSKGMQNEILITTYRSLYRAYALFIYFPFDFLLNQKHLHYIIIGPRVYTTYEFQNWLAYEESGNCDQ